MQKDIEDYCPEVFYSPVGLSDPDKSQSSDHIATIYPCLLFVPNLFCLGFLNGNGKKCYGG